MEHNSFKQIFFLIFLLAVTPFILFLGKNSLQTDFFSTKYFWLAFIYCLFFLFITLCALYFNKKFLIFILFFAYFGFLQLYFYDMQEFLRIYKTGATWYYVLFFIVILSFVTTICSNSLIFRNFVFILLFLNIIISTINLIPVMKKSLYTIFKTKNYNDSSVLKINNITTSKYPNIFYIVPDGLASPKILKEYAGIDFKDSIKKFEKKGFNVPMHNYSSYNITYLSLAALFKMNYPATEKSSKYKDRSNFYPSIREKNPQILQYLKKKNYKFVTVPPMWSGCPRSREYKCLIPNNSYLNIFFQDYSINSFLKNSFLNKLFTFYSIFTNDTDDTVKTTLNRMKSNPSIWSDGGVFTMIHMMIPHKPYRKENCSIIDSDSNRSIQGYKSSVYCSFNRIHELADFIIKNYPNATIVVQADHGLIPSTYSNKFDETSNSTIDHRLGIFSAVRGCKSNEASKLNQANIVKYIVECLVIGKPSKPFENKSYYGFYEDSPDFGKVFRVHPKLVK